MIGGVFALELPLKGKRLPLLANDHVIFLNARSAMAAVISFLRPSTVWLPSYLCTSVLDALTISKTPFRFFPINDHLNVADAGWMSEVRPGDLVVIIDYFGFCGSQWVYGAIKDYGAWVLEDASQALLSSRTGQCSDFVVYSPRKFVGVPDGGILVSKDGFPSTSKKMALPLNWWLKSFGACLLRRDFDNKQTDGEREWFQLFQEVESAMPVGNYYASELSISLLKRGIDWDFVSRERRENYIVLLESLRDCALYKALPDDVVPLGFPITVRNRDELQSLLSGENIYPPVHWRLSNTVPEQFVESHELSKHILTLICDQRYSREDMERIIEVIRMAASVM